MTEAFWWWQWVIGFLASSAFLISLAVFYLIAALYMAVYVHICRARERRGESVEGSLGFVMGILFFGTAVVVLAAMALSKYLFPHWPVFETAVLAIFFAAGVFVFFKLGLSPVKLWAALRHRRAVV